MVNKSIEELVKEVNESSTFARILEVGVGVPISNKLYSFSGASKTIYSVESYYSREAHDRAFGECDSRAVSFERLKSVFENESILSDMESGLYNTVLATTFQVGNMNENNVSTHGWIAVNCGELIDVENYGDHFVDNIKYYHISIHKKMTREEYINTIGEIGVKLLHCKNEFVPSDCWIDMVLDVNGNTDYESSLDAISSCKSAQQVNVFSSNGVDRLESITRGVENLIVYKGSFNPVSIAHQEVVNQTLTNYKEKTKLLFSISVDTYQKGKIDTESLIRRIQNINSLGYDVLITNNGLFVDCLEVLRTKYNGNVVFPLGVDTINRLSTFYYERVNKDWDGNFENIFNKEKFESDFDNCELVCFSRNDEAVDPLLDSGLVSHMEQQHSAVSSTEIRELFENGEDEKAVEMIPHEIRHYVIKHFSKNKNN